MSISNDRKGREPLFAWTSRGSIAYISIITAVSLLAGDGLVLLSPSPPMMMITTTATAQEAEEEIMVNNTTTAEGTTATTDSDTTAIGTTPSPSSSEIHLSPQPIWEERVSKTGETPFNQTHSIITFFGNGTLTVPDTGETIDVTNNGTAIFSSVTGTSFGRESFFSEDDGDSTAITFYEIVKDDPETLQTRGITTAVFDSNGTGTLASFNGMIVIGLREEPPNEEGVTMTLWKWEDEISNSRIAAAPPMHHEPMMNATTTSE